MKKEICLLCKSRIDINEDCENCGSKWDFLIIETIDETLKVLFNHEKKQYVSFLSTGGRFHNYKGKISSTIYTFAIFD